MMVDATRAELLIEALPYIRKYENKTVVVKYGGNAMVSENLKDNVMNDIILMTSIGIRVVLVHGGGPDISDMMKKLGKEPVFVDGLRVTDEETVDIAQMVLTGKIGKDIVKRLQNKGVKSVGICGLDGGCIKASPLDEAHGLVGKIRKVDTTLITTLLDGGFIPIISPIGYDGEGNSYNINADSAASAVAGALKAETLMIMTDTVGILRDVHDPSSLISRIYVSDAPQLMEEGVIAGGMIPKVNCCIEAIRMGVSKVFILDGRQPHSMVMELFTDDCIGTMFI